MEADSIGCNKEGRVILSLEATKYEARRTKGSWIVFAKLAEWKKYSIVFYNNSF